MIKRSAQMRFRSSKTRFEKIKSAGTRKAPQPAVLFLCFMFLLLTVGDDVSD